MDGHAFAKSRYEVANENLDKLTKAMKEGNWSDFSAIVERESWMLGSFTCRVKGTRHGMLCIHHVAPR